MIETSIIVNEREARDARSAVAEIDRALSSEEYFAPIINGLPLEVINGYGRSLSTQRTELQALLAAYDKAKEGDFTELKRRAGKEPGLSLIIARIARGWSQKDLARRMGIKEQQIQRYEAERYRSISLSNAKRVAYALGVDLEVTAPDASAVAHGPDVMTAEYTGRDIKRIIKHAQQHHWFGADDLPVGEDEGQSYLQRYVADYVAQYGSPTLLRTGLNVEDLSDDLALVAWRARVTRRAEAVIEKANPVYRELNITWLLKLVELSAEPEGPLRARDLLLEHGIVLIVEPTITGLKLDGAAFLLRGVPVIGLTIRRDTIDSFWFTLLHEVAHVVLHYRMGLMIGFFDDVELTDIDGIENEANEFAANMLIPNEKWKTSPARIAKSEGPIERFAEELKIHPAIVYGRLQKERNSYATFSSKIGRGQVQTLFKEYFRSEQ